MKNTIVSIIAILLLFTIGHTAELLPSPVQTADAVIESMGFGGYGGIIITTDGTNSCSVTVYDNITNAGKVLDYGTCPGYTVSGQENTCKGLFPWPVKWDRGIYADMTTSGTCSYIIFYSKQ